MTLPTVTELPLKLEPTTPDTFIEGTALLTSAERPLVEGQALPRTLAGQRRAPQASLGSRWALSARRATRSS